MTVDGREPQENNSYELTGTIHVPGILDDQEGIGYYLNDRTIDETRGYSENEAWELLFQHGAVNAQAVFQQKGSRTIQTTEGLPSIESEDWKIPVWKESGELAAPLSEEAWRTLEDGLKRASSNLAREAVANITFEPEINLQELDAAKEAIKWAEKITILTGAGVSTMSGIPDYRSVAIGMWEKDPQLLEHLNEHTFQEEPALFWENFYLLLKNTLRPLMPFPNHHSLLAAIEAISPNETHHFFSWLENEKGKDITIVTQNVDRLHKQAGSREIIEFHGNVLECTCINCQKKYPLAEVLKESGKPECTACGGELRPDAVFFGDPVKGLDESMAAIEKSELVIVAGTSLRVFPFSSLIHHVPSDIKLVYINGEAPEEPAYFDHVITGNLSEISTSLQEHLED